MSALPFTRPPFLDDRPLRGRCSSVVPWRPAIHPSASSSLGVVTIFGFSPDRGFYIEGRAVVLGRGHGPNHFKVRFLGERLTRDRYVHPDWQAHPTRALKLLQDFWSAQKSPDPDDFFPPD